MTKASRWLSILLASGISLGTSIGAQAAFPDHTVHFDLGYAPGGAVDIVTRLVAQKLSEKWNQPVLVENRAGADGSLAANYVAHAAPDGYTIILVTSNHTIPPNGYTLSYDPLKSFAPITQVAYGRNDLVVNASLPVKTLRDFVAMVKSKPGQMNFGGSGTGTTQYLDMAQFMQLTGMNMLYITYKGGDQVLEALLGNEIQMTYGPIPISYELVKAGKLKVLAISGNDRAPTMPDTPTFAEEVNLKDFEGVTWFGVLAPAGTPKDIVSKLHDDIVSVLKDPGLQDTFAKQGITAIGNSPEAFTKVISNDLTKWADLVKTVKR